MVDGSEIVKVMACADVSRDEPNFEYLYGNEVSPHVKPQGVA